MIMFENLTPTSKKFDHPVFALSGVEWESYTWSSGTNAGNIYDIHATREDGASLELTARDDGQVYATVQVQIGYGETADVGQLHPDAETAATWALAFQPATREAAGVVWIQTHERVDYKCWKAGLGTHDRAEIASYSVENWGVERHIMIGERGFTLKLTGYDFGHERERDGRIKTFEEAALAATGIFGLVADRAGDEYRQGFDDGRQALKATVAGL
jgi:hypothetical protein